MDEALRWLHWWTQGCWLNAHPDWHQHEIYQLPHSEQTRLARTRHQQICQQLQLAECPPQPDQMVLRFLTLSATQQQQALALAASICGYRHSDLPATDNESERWCRRIALALRPGSWLDQHLLSKACDKQHYGLILLHLWSEPAVWQRLKLAFKPDYSAPSGLLSQSAPITKLRPVWEAAIWHAEQEAKRC